MSDGVLSRLEERVEDYLTAQDSIGYNRFLDFDWAGLPDSITASNMKDIHMSAVETAMLVEDHIPGYSSEYMRLFQVIPDVSDEQAWKNRQMLHFIFRWVAEEDRHGHILELYMRHSGRRDPERLTEMMVFEGKKKYVTPHEHPTALFAYTSLQEKATQIFYNCLRRSVDEPTLRKALGMLAQDEARHCHFFSQMVIDALTQPSEKTAALVKEAMVGFEMPLAHMLDHYKRKAIQMVRAANGYNYLDAFDHFSRVLRQVSAARTNSRAHPVQDLILLARELNPA
ncbi:MAG: acyl-ACP desaturase [Chloroflexi bacterium]|nr:acyl-ACP desaturase [Chloroflexota bacterium]